MTARRAAHADALTALRSVLGAPPPPAVAELGADELVRLGEIIADAKERHTEALRLALNEALLQVPSLLRGPVSRIVFR